MKYIINNNQSINEILNKCATGDIIYLKSGVYKEKIEIFKDNITIIGEDEKNTIITNHDFYHKIMPDYNECNTFRTYTCYVEGDNVSISNLTIENSSTPSKKYGQAVALHVHGNHFNCSNVTLLSAQDTLFTGPLPKDLIIRHQNFLPKSYLKGTPSIQIYKNCTIKGDVDFIFGCATALFENCNIISIKRDTTNPLEPNGYICAPSHEKETEYGYLFYKCNLLKEDTVTNVYLGRPWRDYGCAAFIECKMDNHINPLGFNKWGNTNRDKTARFLEYTENIDICHREPWVKELSKSEAQQYIQNYFNYIKNN